MDRTLPAPQSWKVRALIERNDEAPRTLYAWVCNGADFVTISCTDSVPELLAMIRFSALGRRPVVRNFQGVLLARTHGWFGRLTRALLPIGVEPAMVCLPDWKEYASITPRPVLELAAIAAAFWVTADGIAGGEAVLDVGPTSLRCVIAPVEVEPPPAFG